MVNSSRNSPGSAKTKRSSIPIRPRRCRISPTGDACRLVSRPFVRPARLSRQMRIQVRRTRLERRHRFRSRRRRRRSMRSAPENVVGVSMPSPYSSRGSIDDALALSRNLGIRCLQIPIANAFEAFKAQFAKSSPACRKTRRKKTCNRVCAE